jgi:DNA-binding XRE family transcriptional regulator
MDWEDLERELHTAGVSPTEIEADARHLLAQARGHQLAETRKQLSLGQMQIAATIGVSVARVSQIEHGEVTSLEVIARYVEALGGPTGPRGRLRRQDHPDARQRHRDCRVTTTRRQPHRPGA